MHINRFRHNAPLFDCSQPNQAAILSNLIAIKKKPTAGLCTCRLDCQFTVNRSLALWLNFMETQYADKKALCDWAKAEQERVPQIPVTNAQ
jgi:hypothetical protein